MKAGDYGCDRCNRKSSGRTVKKRSLGGEI